MKKSIFGIFLILLLMLGLVGCSEEEATTKSSISTLETISEELTITPTEEYIISCLESTPNIIETKAATEENDPNDHLGQEGWYYSSVFFSVDLIDQDKIEGENLLDKATNAGGCIEAYNTVEDAEERNDYLSKFDNKLVFSSGYHEVVGTLVVRTSKELTEEQSDSLVSNIKHLLMGGKQEDTIPIAEGVIVQLPEFPVEYANDQMTEYFDVEALYKIKKLSTIVKFNLTKTFFDEDVSDKPEAVLLFTLNSITEETDDTNDYYRIVNRGGCIEVYSTDELAASRDNSLSEIIDSKHININNYEILTSTELSSTDQEKLVAELTKILLSQEPKQIEISTDHDDFIGKSYKEIIETLKKQGFSNIKEKQEIIEYSKDKDLTCSEITIVGNNSFKSSDKFIEDDEIIITYYVGKKASMPDHWMNFLEKHYTDVEKQFKLAGFTNITPVAHEVDYDESKVFEGSVIDIAIGKSGEVCTFDKGEEFYTNTPIRIDYRVKPPKKETPVVVPEPEPTPAPQPEPKPESNSRGNGGSSNSSSSSGPSVTVPDHEEAGPNLVWVPTNGGKKYHSRSGCSNMENPMQVSVETATANGYTPCKRCH